MVSQLVFLEIEWQHLFLRVSVWLRRPLPSSNLSIFYSVSEAQYNNYSFSQRFYLIEMKVFLVEYIRKTHTQTVKTGEMFNCNLTRAHSVIYIFYLYLSEFLSFLPNLSVRKAESWNHIESHTVEFCIFKMPRAVQVTQ